MDIFFKATTAPQSAAIHRIAPAIKAAPGICIGADDDVKKLNKPVIIGGPTMAVKLITLVKAPCNSPC